MRTIVNIKEKTSYQHYWFLSFTFLLIRKQENRIFMNQQRLNKSNSMKWKKSSKKDSWMESTNGYHKFTKRHPEVSWKCGTNFSSLIENI